MAAAKPRRVTKLLVAGIFLILFAQGTPSGAYKICQRYGICTICDFFSPSGEYQGSIEWCF